MKKFLFSCAFLCAFGAVSVSAQNYDQKITEEYYGEKARDSKRNPCKGYTDKVCYRKTAQLVGGSLNNNISPFSMGGEQTLVKTVVRYPDGEIIEEREEVYDGDVETVKRQLIEEAIMKGGDVEVE